MRYKHDVEVGFFCPLVIIARNSISIRITCCNRSRTTRDQHHRASSQFTYSENTHRTTTSITAAATADDVRILPIICAKFLRTCRYQGPQVLQNPPKIFNSLHWLKIKQRTAHRLQYSFSHIRSPRHHSTFISI